jgi:Flp pilus assembly protein TadD
LALQKSREATEAEQQFQDVLQLNPDNAAARFQMAMLLMARGENALAVSELEKVVQLSPSLVEAHLELARIANESRDWAAIREFQTVLAWNPQDTGTHFSLSIALKNGGQLEEAARELEIAQKLSHSLADPR